MGRVHGMGYLIFFRPLIIIRMVWEIFAPFFFFVGATNQSNGPVWLKGLLVVFRMV